MRKTQVKECWLPLEVGKGKKQILPRGTSKEYSSANILILVHETHVESLTFKTVGENKIALF